MENQENPPSPFDEPDAHRKLALEVEGRKFWVPRAAMAIHSPVFKEMLYGNFSEARKDVIPLPGKKSKDIEEVLRCLIPMPVCKDIDRSNVETILAFADEYQATDLRYRAEMIMAYSLEKCQKSNTQLLDILPIAANWRMKILKECLDRCVDEFRLDKLLPIFKDVPDQVKAYLALGRSDYRLEGSDGGARYSHCGHPYSYRMCTVCMGGGPARCILCYPYTIACDCKAKWMQRKRLCWIACEQYSRHHLKRDL